MPQADGSLRIVGVVPCAGRSTRMGRSKALLDAEGEPFLVRVVETLRGGGCAEVVVVVRALDSAEAELARECGGRTEVNPDPSAGPISSIRVALGACASSIDGVLLLPVDHPRVRPGTVRTLLETASGRGAASGSAAQGDARRDGAGDEEGDRHVAATGGATVFVPRYGHERGHPALLLAPTFPELLDPALEGGARTVVRRDPARVLEVEVDDPGVLQDIDDPAAYDAAFPGGVRPSGRAAAPGDSA